MAHVMNGVEKSIVLVAVFDPQEGYWLLGENQLENRITGGGRKAPV